MSSETEQLLREHSRSLRLINDRLCCAIGAAEEHVGSNDVFLKGIFLAGVTDLPLLTIDSDSAGTYTSFSDDGGSGTFTIDLNGGGDVSFTFPLVLVDTDTIVVKRTISTSDGWYKITGTY